MVNVETTRNGNTTVAEMNLHHTAKVLVNLSRTYGQPAVVETYGATTFRFDTRAVVIVNGATANELRAAYRTVCTRCGGGGIYYWGACVNGQMQFSGTCFRCGGNGVEPVRGRRESATVETAAQVCETCPSILAMGEGRICVNCTEIAIGEIEDAAAAELATAPFVLADGTYTLVYDNDQYFTFRVRSLTRGRLAGKRVVEYLNGPNNELDFQSFAFVNESTINVWRRFEGGSLVNRAREIERIARNDRAGLEAAGLLYAERSGRCRNCNRVLTVPASLAAGYGPDCAANLGIAYGGTETRRRRSTAAPTVEVGSTDACVTCGGEGCDVCNETGRRQVVECTCEFYSMGVEVGGGDSHDFSTSEDCPIHDPRIAAERRRAEREHDDIAYERLRLRGEARRFAGYVNP